MLFFKLFALTFNLNVFFSFPSLLQITTFYNAQKALKLSIREEREKREEIEEREEGEEREESVVTTSALRRLL